jgi:hypothetical protein
MNATKIATELDACRNARPTTQAEVDALLSRIDRAGHAAAELKNVKTSLKLCREASDLSRKYRGLDLPVGEWLCQMN